MLTKIWSWIVAFWPKLFGAVVAAGWQYTVLQTVFLSTILAWLMSNAAGLSSILPASLNADWTPYATWIRAANGWIPLYEWVQQGLAAIGFIVTVKCFMMILRAGTWGYLGSGRG